MIDQVTPSDLKAAGGVLVAFAGVLVTAVGFLIRTAFKMGKDAQKVALALDGLTEMKVQVAQIPVIVTRLGTVEKAWETTRSDIKHLLRGSHPDLAQRPPPTIVIPTHDPDPNEGE